MIAHKIPQLCRTWLLGCGCLFALAASTAEAQERRPIVAIDPPRQGFYSRQIDLDGILIVSHADVSDEALWECARRLTLQLEHCPEIRQNLVAAGAEMHVIGKDQQVTDLPMYRHMKGKPFAGEQTMDQRGRGYGGLHCSCAEENLLKLPSDRYRDHRDICRHEFAHTLVSYGMDQSLRNRVEAQRRRSVASGKWKTMYAETNAQEFFAELTMWYFDSRGDYGRLDPRPREGSAWLREYDLEAYELLDDIYRGRLKPEVTQLHILQPLARERAGEVKSVSSDEPTDVTFHNRSRGVVEYLWIDFGGERKSYGRISPDGQAEISTFVTHPWELRDADGKSLGIYMPERGANRVVVEDIAG